MAVSRRLRFEILRRDGMACRYCGAKAPDVPLTVDHVVPVTLGGGDEPNNLVTACQPCNAGKSSVPADAQLVEDVDATALLFARAVEKAAEARRASILDTSAALKAFYNDWWDIFGDDDDLGVDWEQRVPQFMSRGLTAEDFDRFMWATRNAGHVRFRDRWRYFCGCCWNGITEIEEAARRLIEDGQV